MVSNEEDFSEQIEFSLPHELKLIELNCRRSFKKLAVWEDTLVCSTEFPPPNRAGPSVYNHCLIRSDLRHLDIKRDFRKIRRGFSTSYLAEYDLILSLKDDYLDFCLSYQGKRFGAATNIYFETLP